MSAVIDERDAQALDAYSRVVTEVSERVAPSVASLRVTRPGRAGRCRPGREARWP